MTKIRTILKQALPLIEFALIVLVPIYIVLIFFIIQQRDYDVSLVESRGQALLNLSGVEEERIISNIKQNLTLLSKTPEVNSMDAQRCDDFLAKLLSINPSYANIGVLRPDGELFCSALLFAPGSGNASNRTYFQDAIKSKGFSIGQYQVGQLTHKSTINFGYPLYHSDGSLKGVVYIALDIGWLNNYLENLTLPDGSIVAIIDDAGTVVSKTQGTHYAIGDTMGLKFLSTILSTQGAGSTESVLPDGIDYVFFYTPLYSEDNAPLHLIIGINKPDITTEFDTLLRQDFVGLALAPAISIVMLLLFSNRFQQMMLRKKS